MTPDPAIATAADYADALLTARRAKNVLTLIVLLTLIAQLAVFFVARFTTVLNSASIIAAPNVKVTLNGAPTTATAATARVELGKGPRWYDVAHYGMGIAIFLGVVCTIMLAMVLYLIVKIMLVGRLIGVARVTSAFVWTLFLLLLMFPWQAFLRNADFTNREFMVSGVLYTWDELRARVLGGAWKLDNLATNIVFWARFVAWPGVAAILLLVIHARSNRGMKQALGEDVLSDTTPLS